MPDIIERSWAIVSALPRSDVEPSPLPVAPRFLCLGQVSPEKNFAAAVRVFARCAGRYPTARLTIVSDGPERVALRALADDLGLADRVDFPGWIARECVPEAIRQATAVVIPSFREGLPQVALQAAQMARPVLGANVEGVSDVVIDGETGLLFDRSDESALARGMTALLDNPEQAASLGRAAYQWVQQSFGWESHVQGYDDLIRKRRMA